MTKKPLIVLLFVLLIAPQVFSSDLPSDDGFGEAMLKDGNTPVWIEVWRTKGNDALDVHRQSDNLNAAFKEESGCREYVKELNAVLATGNVPNYADCVRYWLPR